jgi:hypothetical protein
MNYLEAIASGYPKTASPLSPLHLWRGEAFRRGEAKVEASFEKLNPIKLK